MNSKLQFHFHCAWFVSLLLILCSKAEVSDKQELVPYPFSKHSVIKRSVNIKNYDKLSLNEKPECKKELHTLCPDLKLPSDDLSVLTCIQYTQPSRISESCWRIIWKHSVALLSDSNFPKLLQPDCQDVLRKLECKKNISTCVFQHLADIKSNKCLKKIREIEWIAFSDFRLIPDVTKYCDNDIKKLNCQVIQQDAMEFLQGETLACLQEHLNSLEKKCRSQILYLSELQGDDITFDHVLDKACAYVKQKFCRSIQSPDEIYNCLMQRRNDNLMTEDCRKQLERRERLISQDFRVSKGLARACKDSIKTYRCRRLVSDDKEIRLAQILVCLENAVHNGSHVINSECIREMKEHRKILFDNYKLTPELVNQCSYEISNFCKGKFSGSETIHCLMEHSHPSRKTDRVHFECQQQVEMLVKTTDIGEDWMVDPVLYEACQSVVTQLCPDLSGGDARVISCLMDRLEAVEMTKECEKALLEIQYFVSRNFKLDPKLFRACRFDAVTLCDASGDWATQREANSPKSALVLPCLYRYLKNSEVKKLRPTCRDEIRRVMRQRALQVDLHPEIEQVCIDDLAAFCSVSTSKGHEILCLQKKLSQLKNPCREVIKNFTEVQIENVHVNPFIMKNCAFFIEKYCSNEGPDVMECLVSVKNEKSLRDQVKCRAEIEHYQLISLQDYRFTVAFRNACQSSVVRYCPTASTKPQVIECLSEILRNDTLQESRNRIPKPCRQQLRTQLLYQRENIEFNPKLKNACQVDIDTFCLNSTPGSAQILECLMENKKKLSDKCRRAVFKIEVQDLRDSSSDYTLLSVCRAMIRIHCHDPSQALTCLKEVKDEPGFDQNCKKIVVKRIIEQNQDYRFNPTLTKACKVDIAKFCSDLIKHSLTDTEMEGKVVKCLKMKFRDRKLRAECMEQLVPVLKEAALNYKLNPLLQNMCTDEIKQFCSDKDDNQESGSVEECLKTALQNGQIVNRACRLEVVGLIEDARVDIHVDPLLHRACASDLKINCADIPAGGGRHIQCLLNILDDPFKAETLSRNCHVMLSQRVELFKEVNHFVALPETMKDLYGQMSRSPSKKYFLLVMFSFVGMVFLSGLFFGRASRRLVLSLLVTNSKSKL